MRLATSGVPPALSRSAAAYWPPGIRLAISGVRSEIVSKSSIVSGTPTSHAGDRVLEGIAGEHVERAHAACEQIHDQLAGAPTNLHFSWTDNVAPRAIS